MATEIERKFLLTDEGWRDQVESSTPMRQGYLGGDRCSVRVRVAGDQARLNIKSRQFGMRRSEYEYPLPMTDATEMLEGLCEGPLVEKVRHRVRVGAHVWEIDEFLGDSLGLIVAEVELQDESESFERPSWLGREVTDDRRYYNVHLARHPYREWKDAP